MKFFVYVIKSQSTGRIYIGHTNNLAARLARHNGELPRKKSSFTSKNSGPWILIYFETYNNRDDARRREQTLKSGKGREFIKKIINDRP